MAYWKVPGLSVAVIREGKLAWAKGYGVLQVGKAEKVNTQTVFSVGSVSKVGAAAITLRLVDAGKLELDRNVNDYLSRWQVPDNEYTVGRPVTLRAILAHTAGLSVHGFDDYQPGEPQPTLLDSLEGRAPAKNLPVRVEYFPGMNFSYSGGGTTVEQLVVEEVSGVDFDSAARQYLFEPLAMLRSTYQQPLPVTFNGGNIAKAHGKEGKPRALPRGYETMPETAASGLWTTPTDFAQLIIALLESFQGKSTFLSAASIKQMMTEVAPGNNGLGPELQGEGPSRRFLHSGANDSYRAWSEGHVASGNGLIVFTNSPNGAGLYGEVRRAVAIAEGWSGELRDDIEIAAR